MSAREHGNGGWCGDVMKWSGKLRDALKIDPVEKFFWGEWCFNWRDDSIRICSTNKINEGQMYYWGEGMSNWRKY